MAEARIRRGDRDLIRHIRRAWSLLQTSQRRRLALVAAYGVVIAALETLALLALFALINVLLSQPLSGVVRALVPSDVTTSDARFRTAALLLAVTSSLLVVRSLLSIFGVWLTVGAANSAQADLIRRLLEGHARAPYLDRIERKSSETLRTVLFSVDQVIGGIVSGSVSLAGDGAIALAVVIGLFLSSPLIAAVVVSYFIFVAFVWVRVVRRGLTRRGRLVQELTDERFKLVLQGIAAAKELELRGRSLFYADAAVDRTRRINRAARGATVVNSSLRYVLETALVVGTGLIVAVAMLAGGRESVLPAVGLVLAAAFRLLPALNRILFVVNQVQYSKPALDIVEDDERRVAPFIRLGVGSDEATHPLALEHDLRVHNVSFRYKSRRLPALVDVSFVVRAGTSVGILGSTGSGKSTLLDILLGVIDPDSGAIAIDGTNLSICRERWQRAIGYVPQDVYLVDDTLCANVALGWRGSEIDDAAVHEALELAQLDTFVEALPEGINTLVGERGVHLSGGQRQRIGIARALYVRPTVLILDEATSNLDPQTEAKIVEGLASLRPRLTRLIVTHRVSTARACDDVLFLDGGVVRARGFEQLKRLPLSWLAELKPPSVHG